MSRSPSSPKPDRGAPSTTGQPARQVQRSRIGLSWVGGHFDPAVVVGLKTLALREGTTVQSLLARAVNDLLERHGLGRPASEAVLPRGGAAQHRGEPGQRTTASRRNRASAGD